MLHYCSRTLVEAEACQVDGRGCAFAGVHELHHVPLALALQQHRAGAVRRDGHRVRQLMRLRFPSISMVSTIQRKSKVNFKTSTLYRDQNIHRPSWWASIFWQISDDQFTYTESNNLKGLETGRHVALMRSHRRFDKEPALLALRQRSIRVD